MTAVSEVRGSLPCVDACDALGLPRATYYRRTAPAAELSTEATADDREKKPHPRAISPAEEKRVLEHLYSSRFANLAVPQVYATLLEEGTYLASPRSMYRILDRRQEVKERRNQARRPNYAAPELLATKPNEVWSWDITKLRGPEKWTYFYLYVMLDIFSRSVVGWMVARCESAALARKLLAESVAKHDVKSGQLTCHSDRGAPMTSKSFALLLTDLGVAQSLNRPYVSNDNPFSEALFKTAKYSPAYPGRFGGLEDARAWAAPFFQYCNHEHHHSRIGMMTPADVHLGRVEQVREVRQGALDAAYARNPERFVRKPPVAPKPPSAVWINPPKTAESAH